MSQRAHALRLPLVLEVAGLGLWEADLAAGRIEASPLARRILGFDADQPLTLAAWLGRAHADDGPRLREWLASLIGAGDKGAHSIEHRLRVPSGHAVWVEVHAQVLLDGRGRARRILGTVRDSRQAQRAAVEQRLRLALDAACMVTWTLDLRRGCIDPGAGMLEMLGLVHEGPLPLARWLALIHPEDREHIQRAVNFMVSKGSGFDTEYRVVLPGGRTRWISAQAMAIADETGSVACAYGIATDISARKRAENKVRDRERQLRSITDAVPVGITRCSRDLRYLFVNRTYAHSVLQLEPEQVVGRTLRALLGEERFRQILPNIRRVLTGERVQYESRVPGASGEHILHTVYVPEHDAQGKVSGWIAVITDISERKRAEARLYQREREFKTLVENAPDVIARLDRELRLAYINRAVESAFGLDALQIIGGDISALQLPADVTDAIGVAARNAFDSGEELPVRFSLEREPEVRHFMARVVPEFDREDQVESVLMIIYDVTERVKTQIERDRLLAREHSAREQAEAAARARDQFLAIVSHELRSPLNAIQSWTHVLDSRIDAPAPGVQRALTGIKAGVEQQVRLIDDLLDATRIMSGKLSIVKQPVLVQPVIEAALASVRAAAERKSIRLHTQLDAGGGQISGDPDRLQQMVWNLLSNAVKFTPAGGNVWLSAQCRDGQLEVVVRDDGKGIAGPFLPRLFDWFRRDETGNSRGQDGLGLGLALVHHLCELHGGSVRAESAGIGRGASFSLRLPLRVPAPIVAEPSHSRVLARPQQLPSLQGLHVLLVEDQAETRESLVLLLENAGAQVLAFGSSEEAQRWLASGDVAPDVLVSDIAMPGEDGYSLMHKIRSREQQAGIPASERLPALALTALAQREDRLRTLAAGFQMHLAKPVSPDELVVVIATLARRISAPGPAPRVIARSS